MKVYLCGPINGRSDDDCNNWRDAAILVLGSANCINSMRRDYRGRELEPGIAAEIVAGDEQDIRDSDVCLVYYDQPSVGTAMEMRMAKHELQKRVVLVNKSTKPLSPWLIHHSTVVLPSLDAALALIQRWRQQA